MAVWDRRSGRTYLVDCGADFSVFPASTADKKSRFPSTPLVAANGSPIKTWGKRNISLLLGQGRSFVQEFHVADVTEPILGSSRTISPLTWPGAASLPWLTSQRSRLGSLASRRQPPAFTHPRSTPSIASSTTSQSFSSPASSPWTQTSMGLNTTSPQRVLRSTHAPAASMQTSWPWPSPSSPRWSSLASSVAPTRPGLPRYTSFVSLAEAGGLVVTSAASTMPRWTTATRSLTFRTSTPAWPA